MRSKERMNGKPILQVALAWMIIGWMCCGVGSTCNAQTPPSNLSPDLQEVVKLSQAHMGDDVIVNYIRNSGKSYKLSADDLIYLNSQGVSQGVISALQTATSPSPNPAPVAPAPATPASYAPTPAATGPVPPPPAPAPVNDGACRLPGLPLARPRSVWITFTRNLRPSAPGWKCRGMVCVGGRIRRYEPIPIGVRITIWGSGCRRTMDCFGSRNTRGETSRFTMADGCWCPVEGWLWAPDVEWGPAWVFWRHAEADGAIGWAPLPVGAVFVGGGFMYRGARVGVDFDFGLGEGVFVFVGYDHFHEGFFRMRGREWAWHIGGERFHAFYGRSVLRNEFRRDEHGRFVNGGIGHDRMARATHGRVEQAHFEERRPVGDRAALAHGAAEKPGEKAGASKVYRPPAAAAAKPAAASSSAKKK